MTYVATYACAFSAYTRYTLNMFELDICKSMLQAAAVCLKHVATVSCRRAAHFAHYADAGDEPGENVQTGGNTVRVAPELTIPQSSACH